ncbi:hypothetical protein [Aliagarivorans marinus]|uniref:hypothetical protein n=1 Tax=Aliagarivorans marinus TaxID=561965 RepID=UPI00047A8F6B|nr:hypothetical protein [Aliagarivorans marinus]
MPFTPVHMGPGILIKALLQGSFSLMIFGWTQIVMDIQPLWVLISGEGALHGSSHTWLGATLLAPLAALSGKHLSEFGLRLLELSSFTPISWRTCFVSAFIGSYSHILLDSVMHSDMLPFYPLSEANGLLGLVSVATLHKFCYLSGAAGMVLYVLVLAWQRAIETES